ncbi:MAG: putative toxin-antitoxin system toxin component, PIN family [Thermococcus sp.]|uniref:putative toxin-antitoxin system toxin component, PIN family n=1 Tax=Thermococcus sp. TaxID=35749 RepID=UPI001D28EF7A|nr:putative toxin-antitoxin system toxin component, PIN family [Thermococcus sp.]MBO8175199.1 putative toxin-antitoxin system toxin component, PIN family [Thermococcus sp.]
MKLVMDTNVVLAAMIKPKGLAALLIELLDKEHFINYTSPEALEELQVKMAILEEERKLSENWLQVLANFLYGTEIVKPKEHFNLCRDEDDNKWLDIAYEAKVQVILTWDDDLLDLRNDKKVLQLKNHQIKILRPIEFLKEELRKRC